LWHRQARKHPSKYQPELFAIDSYAVYITCPNQLNYKHTMQALQQEIAQAEAKVAELREKLKRQKSNERSQAITSVKELMKLHDLVASDLGINGKNVRSSKRLTRADKGLTVAPKYADPISGSTWTGRGRPPVWLAQHLAAGRSKDDYLISAKK
jgi:DNA-binding protein H-NS